MNLVMDYVCTLGTRNLSCVVGSLLRMRAYVHVLLLLVVVVLLLKAEGVGQTHS
jgi:hypothetical protein